MRTHTAGERTALAAANVSHAVRVEVRDADAAWRDWTGWVTALSWEADIEQPTAGASFSLHRGLGTGSLSPFMSTSLLNRDAASAFAPAVDIGRDVRISTNAGPDGWIEQFIGRVDTLDAGQDPVPVTCSDLGAWLMDTQMEAARAVGSSAGVAVETEIQAIIDAYPSGIIAPTLYTPTSPLYFLYEDTVDPVKVLDAVRALALNIGWDVRYRYDAAHVSRLTLLDPDRTRTTVDGSIGPGEYVAVPSIPVSLAPIRNAGRWYYGADASEYVTYEDTASISKYGRRWFQIPVQGGIDTLTEAQRAIDAAGNDMSGPGTEFALKTFYLWPVQLFDRWTFQADAKGFDQDQTVSVTSYRHEWVGGALVTTITGTARVVGAYKEWRRRIVGPPRAGPSLVVHATHGTSSTSIAYTHRGTIRLSVNGGASSTPAASPIVVTHTASPQTYALTASADGQEISVPTEIPAYDPSAGVTMDLGAPVADAALDTLTITYTLSGAPSGASVNLTWSVDGGASGSATNIASGHSVSTPIPTGASGQVTITLVDGNRNVIKQAQHTGTFAT